MREETLLTRAKDNLRAAKTLFQAGSGDDDFCNIVGYHLQQATELFIKYQLEQSGVHYPKVHEIETLLRIARENNTEIIMTDYVVDHAETVSAWEAKTRYVLSYLVERRTIEKMLPEIEKSIELYQEQKLGRWVPPEE
jgi:HEPN domain-containing protein